MNEHAALVEDEVFNAINSALSSIDLQTINYGTATITLTGLTFDPPTVTSRLLELSESQPCQDAIQIDISMNTLQVAGKFGSTSFTVDVSGLSAVLRGDLTLPVGLNEVTADAYFDRYIQRPQLISFTVENINTVLAGGNYLESYIINIMESQIINQTVAAIGEIFQTDELASYWPAPVTIAVTVEPSP